MEFWIGAICADCQHDASVREGFNAYDQVARQDLEDLCAQAGTASEDLLEQIDQEVAHWCADEGSICRHLGHAGAEIMAMRAAVVREPRCEDFLQSSEGAGREHLSPKRVLLELREVGLLGLSV